MTTDEDKELLRLMRDTATSVVSLQRKQADMEQTFTGLDVSDLGKSTKIKLAWAQMVLMLAIAAGAGGAWHQLKTERNELLKRMQGIEKRLVGASEKGWHRVQADLFSRQLEKLNGNTVKVPDVYDIPWYDADAGRWKTPSGTPVLP